MWCNQIFSLIKDNIIQNIIVADNYEVASQIAIDQFGKDAIAVDTTQFPLVIGYKYINGAFFEEDGETVVNRNLTADETAAMALQKTEALEAQINTSIDTDTATLDEVKTYLIVKSKENLESYITAHPITSSCHGGVEKQYTITKDKQTLLTQMILITQVALSVGVEYQPSWNAQGEPCTYDWTLQELQQLAFEAEAIVRPLISHQQTIEAEINTAGTKEDALAVDITF